MKISTVADALAAMDYLHRRKLLCDKCGIKLATKANVNNSRCDDHVPTHGEFRSVLPPNKLEETLCKEVNAWLERDSETPSEST